MNARRVVASLVVEATLESDPGLGWGAGPYAFPLPGGGPQTAGRTDREARLTYFHPRTSAILYGTPDESTRWHREGTDDLRGCKVDAVELLRTPQFVCNGVEALAVVHLALPAGDPVDKLAELVRITNCGLRGEFNSIIQPATLAPTARRATSVVYAHLDKVEELLGPAFASWDAIDQCLWPLAAATPAHDGSAIAPIVPDPQDPSRTEGLVYLSSSWRALVLRDGVAFVGDGSADVTGSFLDQHAPVYVRSIYLDAILLGLLQYHGLNSFANRLAALDDRSERHAQVPTLEDELTRFRNTLWWQHVTRSGPGNDLLVRYQAQHGLPDLLAQIVGEFGDYARQVESASNLRTGAALGLITLFGLPLTLALTGDPVLTAGGSLRLLIVVALGLVIGLTLFLVPAARELMHPLRRRR